jgi:hypothetical protein
MPFGNSALFIITRWHEIVGERYARASAPESIRFPLGKREEGTLTIVTNGAHAPMMQHVAPVILEKVNLFFGYAAVAKVVIRQGEVRRAAPPAPAISEPVAVPVDLGDSLRTVADPELRAVLESLAKGVAARNGVETIGRIK